MDKPVPKLDWVPPGTVSLKGKVLLGPINQERIDRCKVTHGLEDDFARTSEVAFSQQQVGKDLEDLKNTLDPNRAIVAAQAHAKLLVAIHPAEFLRLCRLLDLDPQKSRIFLYPEGDDYAPLAVLVKNLIKGEPTELGSFGYDGNLTIELLEPYLAMEAKESASEPTRTGDILVL